MTSSPKKTPKKSGNKHTLEPCARCNGAGEYMIRLGYPNQDPRELGGYAKIKWKEREGPFPCKPCNGTGQRKAKKPIIGSYVITDDPEPQFEGQATT